MNTSKSNKFALLLLLILPFFMNSCVVNYYKAGRKNVPGLEKQGDLKVALSMNTKGASNILTSGDGGSANRIDASISYSPTQHLGILLNTNTNILSMDYLLFGVSSPISLSRFYELHAGYYKDINETTLFEAYAFGALGSIKPLADNLDTDISQNRFGVNTGVWFKVKKWRFGLHTGLSKHSFSNQLFEDDVLLTNASTFNSTSLSSAYAEHSLSIKYVIDQVELEAQFGRINRLNGNSDKAGYSYNPKNFSLGILYNIGGLLSKQPTVSSQIKK